MADRVGQAGSLYRCPALDKGGHGGVASQSLQDQHRRRPRRRRPFSIGLGSAPDPAWRPGQPIRGIPRAHGKRVTDRGGPGGDVRANYRADSAVRAPRRRVAAEEVHEGYGDLGRMGESQRVIRARENHILGLRQPVQDQLADLGEPGSARCVGGTGRQERLAHGVSAVAGAKGAAVWLGAGRHCQPGAAAADPPLPRRRRAGLLPMPHPLPIPHPAPHLA